MSSCCQQSGLRASRRWGRKIGEGAAWTGSGTLLLLMPKCPICIATYVMVWTGMSLSLATAAWLRWGLLVLSVASLLVLMLNRRKSLVALCHYLRKEN